LPAGWLCWNNRLDERSRIPVSQPQLSPELFCALIHSVESDANRSRTRLRSVVRHSFAVIKDLEKQLAGEYQQGNARFAGSRMAKNVPASVFTTSRGNWDLRSRYSRQSVPKRKGLKLAPP